MWKQQILNIAEQAGRSFHNHKVFERIRSNNDEYNVPIYYLPLREYCESRFLRALELYGAARVPELINESLPSIRDNVSITNETHALALIIGIRESGMPFLGRGPSEDRSFTRPSGATYIRNFRGSGLDKVYMPSIQRRMRRYLNYGAMRHLVVDDPDSSDNRFVGIRHDRIRTIFNVYLRQQNDTFLGDLNLESMDRVTRLFWRALTFGGQGGSSWEESRAGGRNSLKTLVVNLLRTDPSNVKNLWDIDEVKRILDSIVDRNILKKIARHPTTESIRHQRGSNDIIGWRNLAKNEIEKGLGTPRYFQAIKAAAITEGILACTTWP